MPACLPTYLYGLCRYSCAAVLQYPCLSRQDEPSHLVSAFYEMSLAVESRTLCSRGSYIAVLSNCTSWTLSSSLGTDLLYQKYDRTLLTRLANNREAAMKGPLTLPNSGIFRRYVADHGQWQLDRISHIFDGRSIEPPTRFIHHSDSGYHNLGML